MDHFNKLFKPSPEIIPKVSLSGEGRKRVPVKDKNRMEENSLHGAMIVKEKYLKVFCFLF